MICKNGVLEATIPGQFDGQIHSVEWFHNGEWRRIPDTIYPLQDSEILDDTLDCGGFCFTNQLKPFPDDKIKDENGNWVDNPNSLKNLKQLEPIRILWDSEEDFETEDKSTDFDKNLALQLDGKIPVEKPMWRYRIVDEINVHGEGMMFKVTVKTVEATKLLELVQCDTLTFTNKLGHDYVYGTEEATYKELDKGDWSHDTVVEYADSTRFYTKVVLGKEYKMPQISFYYKVSDIQPRVDADYFSLTITSPEGKSTKYSTNRGIAATIPNTYVCSEKGKYTFTYEVCFIERLIYNHYWYIEFTIETGEAIPSKPFLTISECMGRIADFGETRRYGIEQPRFNICKNVQQRYQEVRAPEFHITRSTMWEAFKVVAGHVHCIPRLNWDENSKAYKTITFDELGQIEECKLKALHNNMPIAWDIRKSLDSYCGEINTYVDNLVNTRDEAMGCIVEPYASGWKSARSSELIVNDDTVKFLVQKPIYRIVKVEIKFDNQEADITPYIYEQAEYNALSNFEGTGYPDSQAYALKYEQGGKEIYELNHKVEGWSGAFANPAIINIAKQFGITILPTQLKDILYRITYTPLSSARIVEEKPYIQECNGYSRNYNVAGNTIENEYLGEHLKGAIARLGNDIEYRTYMFERGKDVPKPGTILDDKYIMKVTTQMSSVHFIKATLMLSSDYNQKNEYVAIDSNVRYYDVSEKQSVERHVNYNERVLIGDKINPNEETTTIDYCVMCEYSQTDITGQSGQYYGSTTIEFHDGEIISATPSNLKHSVSVGTSSIRITATSLLKGPVYGRLTVTYYNTDNKTMVSPAAIEIFSKVFSGDNANDSKISWAWFQGESKKYGSFTPNKTNPLLLSCLSQSSGNGLVFNFSCEDNYGGGYAIKKEINGAQYVQTQIPYSNLYGEFEKMDLVLGNKIQSSSASVHKELPLWTGSRPEGLISTNAHPLLIDKDSREQLNITVQFQFIANRKSIILGTALGANNPLVTDNNNRKATCYLLPNKINKFATRINVSDGFEITADYMPTNISYTSFELPTIKNTSGKIAHSIVWVDECEGKSNARLIIGENSDILPNENSLSINFAFVANDWS